MYAIAVDLRCRGSDYGNAADRGGGLFADRSARSAARAGPGPAVARRGGGAAQVAPERALRSDGPVRSAADRRLARAGQQTVAGSGPVAFERHAQVARDPALPDHAQG